MVMLDQNRVDIVYEISEGPKSKVQQINILGMTSSSDGKLRGEMAEAGPHNAHLFVRRKLMILTSWPMTRRRAVYLTNVLC